MRNGRGTKEQVEENNRELEAAVKELKQTLHATQLRNQEFLEKVKTPPLKPYLVYIVFYMRFWLAAPDPVHSSLRLFRTVQDPKYSGAS